MHHPNSPICDRRHIGSHWARMFDAVMFLRRMRPATKP
jgi:hypothetical protein